jgi:hypothetical protein
MPRYKHKTQCATQYNDAVLSGKTFKIKPSEKKRNKGRYFWGYAPQDPRRTTARFDVIRYVLCGHNSFKVSPRIKLYTLRGAAMQVSRL